MQSLKVADFMKVNPLVLKAEMTVAQAVEALLERQSRGAPVVDEHKRLIGFVSEQDCLQKMLESGFYREQAARVRDIMQTAVLIFRPYHSVMDVAELMIQAKPKIYPILDDDGVLKGCITRADVLRAIDMHLRDGYRQAV